MATLERGPLLPEKSGREREAASLRTEGGFESARFYETLYDILVNQYAVGREGVKKGDACLYFNAWKEPYRVDSNMVYEICIDIIVGSVEASNPLTFSEALRLNTYQGSLSYFSGSLTFSRGSMGSCNELIPVDFAFFQRLTEALNVRAWTKEVSYNEKHITAFVRRLENYFMGRYPGKNYRVIQKDVLVDELSESKAIVSLIVEAPEIAVAARPGQFVVIRLHERGERIPLTISDTKKEAGLIRIIFKVVGKTTEQLASVEEGEFILDLLGPLGTPIKIKKYDKPVICIGGGVGIASIYTKAKALKEKGNYVISIIGANNKDTLILEDEMRKVSDELWVTTDDGSYKFTGDGSECLHKVRVDGSKVYGGFVTHVLEALLGEYTLLARANKKIREPNKRFLKYGPRQLVHRYNVNSIAEIIAVGPVQMMHAVVQAVARDSKEYNPKTDCRGDLVKTLVSLNPIMVDGIGMCGCCRVRIYNPDTKKYETKFACIDGPVFNGHLVDFEALLRRNVQYTSKEERSLEYLESKCW